MHRYRCFRDTQPRVWDNQTLKKHYVHLLNYHLLNIFCVSAIPNPSELQTLQTQTLSSKTSVIQGRQKDQEVGGTGREERRQGWLPGGGDWIWVWRRKDETGKWKSSSSQKLKTGSTQTWGAEGAWGTCERHVILLDLGRLENEVKGRRNQPERALAISLGLYSVNDSGLWKYFMQGINTIWIVFYNIPIKLGMIHIHCVCVCALSRVWLFGIPWM